MSRCRRAVTGILRRVVVVTTPPARPSASRARSSRAFAGEQCSRCLSSSGDLRSRGGARLSSSSCDAIERFTCRCACDSCWSRLIDVSEDRRERGDRILVGARARRDALRMRRHRCCRTASAERRLDPSSFACWLTRCRRPRIRTVRVSHSCSRRGEMGPMPSARPTHLFSPWHVPCCRHPI